MADHDEFFSEEQAAALWKRAAMLQSEAIQQAEAARRERAGTDLAGTSDVDADRGYALEHVRAAAVEAGIGAEFLDAALTDMKAEQVMKPERPSGRLLRRFIGSQPDVITARRLIEAPPAKVLKAMEELLPKEPYKLTLVDRSGEPLNGGLLTFNIEGAGWTATAGFAYTAAAADLRKIIATLVPIGEDGTRCELTVHGPVAWAQRTNAAIGAGLVTVGSGLGFGGGTLAGTALATALVASGVGAVVAAGAAAAVTVGSTVLAAVGGTLGFQKMYDYSIGKGQEGMDAMLSAIAIHAQGGWGLGPSGAEDDVRALATPRTPEAP